MTPSEIERARNARELKYFHPIPGMRFGGERSNGQWEWARICSRDEFFGLLPEDLTANAIVDITDPITAMCFLLLVQEAYECPYIYLLYDWEEEMWFLQRPVPIEGSEWLRQDGTWGGGEVPVVGGPDPMSTCIAALSAREVLRP